MYDMNNPWGMGQGDVSGGDDSQDREITDAEKKYMDKVAGKKPLPDQASDNAKEKRFHGLAKKAATAAGVSLAAWLLLIR